MISRKQYLRVCRLIALTMSCTLISGCFEDTKQEFTLNPDGAGKMLVESTFVLGSEAIRDDNQTGEAAVQEAVREILTQSEGIEVWRDISFNELKDGSFFFRGTAYFPDLSKVKLRELAAVRFFVQRDSANNLVLSQVEREAVAHNWDFPGTAFPSLNEPITPESIRRERRRFRAGKPMLLAMLGNKKQELTFHVPGVVRRSSNFETVTPGVLRVRFNGERAVNVLEEIISDDKVMQALSTNTSAQAELATILIFNEKVYGEKSTIQAIIRPDNKPAFDYRSEVAGALKEFPAVARKVGLPDGTLISTAQTNQLIAAKVTGIQWMFGTAREEYVLSLAFQLPGPVLHTGSVELESAQTYEGVNLLRDHDWPDALNWASLEKDNKTVSFSARLKAPPLNSRGIAKVAGVLHCASIESISWTEFVSGELVVGAKGSRFGATIYDIQRPPGQPEKLILESNGELEGYHSFRIEGAPEQFVELRTEGTSQINGRHLRTLVASGPLPKRGKLSVEVSKEVPTLKFPFVVSDLTLLGRPRTQN